MKLFFHIAVGLSCASAAIVAIDMLRSADPIYAASIIVTTLMLTIASIVWRVGHHLSDVRIRAGSNDLPASDPLLTSMAGLNRWLYLAALFVAIAMGAILGGIASRVFQGFPLFGLFYL